MHSPDLTEANLDKIAEIFPQVMTESTDEEGKIIRAVDFDLLRQELSDHVVEGPQERYHLDWPGKRAALFAANAPIAKTLLPMREESVDFYTTRNLFIEGDNLDALKLLQESYLGKVDVIYIDPPYNTGNDFVYNDDFAESSLEYLLKSGQSDSDGSKLVANPESNGRFHSTWLSMMYPRLRLARSLLADDGVIFLSIDDHEGANARKVMDEIFGGSNFLNEFAWVVNLTGRQLGESGAAKTWERVLCYARKVEFAPSMSIDVGMAKDLMPDGYKGFKKDIREDSKGAYAVGDTLWNHNRMFNESTRPNLVYSLFFDPASGDITPGDIGDVKAGYVEILPHANGDGRHKFHAWRWSRGKVESEKDDLLIEQRRGGYEVYTKTRGFQQTTLKDLITNVSNGLKETSELFDGAKYFDYPKPTSLIRVFLASLPSRDGIVLDFFAGSGTTGHAVMHQNLIDGGTRRFILVQLDEEVPEGGPAQSAGFATIAGLARERLVRAGAKVQKTGGPAAEPSDFGFRSLKVDSTCMNDLLLTPDETGQAELALLEESVKADRAGEDLLFQVLLDWGLELSLPIEQTDIGGPEVFIVDGGALVACFESSVTAKTVRAIADLKPLRAVFRDSAFDSPKDRINAEQIFAEVSPETDVKVI